MNNNNSYNNCNLYGVKVNNLTKIEKKTIYKNFINNTIMFDEKKT